MFTKLNKVAPLLVLALAMTLAMGALAAPPEGKGKPDKEGAGNNLSYPVLWAEGIAKVVPGTPEMEPLLTGEWWYQWGTNGSDPNVTPASCAPDPDNEALCDDGIPGVFDTTLVPGSPIAENPLPLVKAYLQKDPGNIWQAGSLDASAAPLNVDFIDWGDNLESVDWYTRSQVRTEVVLFEVVDPAMVEYEMRHTSGWGIDEAHGMAVTLEGAPILGPGTQATVYSTCARLTIQKLLVEREDPALADLVWVPGEGWTGDGLINEPIFNMAVHESSDGPGYYNAETNVKGRIIYGYTWNVRRLNEGAGDYRATFSFDTTCAQGVGLNTFFDANTQILVPLEEEVTTESESPGGGATAALDTTNNLTYIDIRILERSGGGGGGGGGGGNGGGGGGGGGRPHTSPTSTS